jgi:hypothetical protein
VQGVGSCGVSPTLKAGARGGSGDLRHPRARAVPGRHARRWRRPRRGAGPRLLGGTCSPATPTARGRRTRCAESALPALDHFNLLNEGHITKPTAIIFGPSRAREERAATTRSRVGLFVRLRGRRPPSPAMRPSRVIVALAERVLSGRFHRSRPLTRAPRGDRTGGARVRRSRR